MDEDIEDGEAMVVVHEFATEEGARTVGAELVAHGVGAEVEPVPAAELPEGGPQAGYRVLVLDHELPRAREIIGLAEPEDRPPANPEEPMTPVKAKTNWKLVLAIWFAALIILPVLAFAVTAYLVAN